MRLKKEQSTKSQIIQLFEFEIITKSLKTLQDEVLTWGFEVKRFDTRHGIIIEGIFPEDFSCDVVPWTSDERLNIVNDGVFPDGYRLETDIYYIKDSKTAGALDGTTIPAQNILLKSMLLKRETCEDLDYQYKCAVRFNNAWKFHEPQKDKDIAFRVDAVESFCVISIVPEERHTILPSGGHFISPIDNRIQVRFPPNVVDKEEKMSIMIHPINLKCLSEKSYQDTDNEVVCISAITHGLSSKHRRFNQSLNIQLPLHYLHGFQKIEDDCEYKIFKWDDDDGSFEFVNIKPVIQNNIASFQANSFSGYGCVSASKSISIPSLGSFVQEAYGLRMWCKILFFVGKKTNKNLQIMLECVDLQRVSEVCENRKKYGYHFVSEWISKDFFLIPDKTIITVDVKGKFAIPKESNVKHPKLSFIPVAQDNFTRFPVDLKTSGTVYGVLSIRDNKSVLDEILYDPDSKRTTPLNKKIRAELIGNRNDQLVISRSPTTGNRNEEGSVDNRVSDRKDDFFTEKGLLALSKLMSPSTILEVCVNMDVPTAQCETIQQKYGNGTPMANINLLQTALHRQPQRSKFEKMIGALIFADQRSIVDKIQHLQSTGKGLHTI